MALLSMSAGANVDKAIAGDAADAWRLGEQLAFGWNEHTLGRTHSVGCSYYMHWQLFLHDIVCLDTFL